MTEIKDLTDQIINYTSAEYIGSSVMVSLGAFGCITTGTLLFALGQERAQKSSGLYLYESFFSAGFLISLEVLFFNAKDLYYGGMSMGPKGCVVSAVFNLGFCCISILSLLAIATERYVNITLAIHPNCPKINFKYVVLAIWIFAISFSTLPVYTGNFLVSFALQPGKLMCCLSWWEKDAASLSVTAAALFTMISCTLGMTFCYYNVFMTVFTVSKNAKSSKLTGFGTSVVSSSSEPQSAESAPQIREKRNHEREVLIKAVAVTGTFLTFWTPYL